MSDTENICKMKSYRCAGALAFVLCAVRVFCVIVLSLHVCKLFIDGFIIYIYQQITCIYQRSNHMGRLVGFLVYNVLDCVIITLY